MNEVKATAQTQQPQTQQIQTRQIQTPYEAPRVEDLGAWQAVTLITTLPMNSGGIFDPSGMGGPNGQ